MIWVTILPTTKGLANLRYERGLLCLDREKTHKLGRKFITDLVITHVPANMNGSKRADPQKTNAKRDWFLLGTS
ncbi:ASN_collapsed_G0028090.mRNA.1.CDS.1 [Saccharomyces cerevisiae]|nr:ASN_collapsed_G0028090.mRNA.1.CDS.1 [Saccharomyces cerevisiae]